MLAPKSISRELFTLTLCCAEGTRGHFIVTAAQMRVNCLLTDTGDL